MREVRHCTREIEKDFYSNQVVSRSKIFKPSQTQVMLIEIKWKGYQVTKVQLCTSCGK